MAAFYGTHFVEILGFTISIFCVLLFEVRLIMTSYHIGESIDLESLIRDQSFKSLEYLQHIKLAIPDDADTRMHVRRGASWAIGRRN